MQKDISNGILLAEIVSTIFNVKIHGIFKDPKTEVTTISNIRKPLEILRRQTKMSQKFTWTEREIFEGKISVFIGLLEDLHRCFDGLPPRKRGLNYFKDGPYLGDTLYDTTEKTVEKVEHPQKVEEKKPMDTIMNADLANKIDGLLEKSKYQELPSIFKNHKFLIGSSE